MEEVVLKINKELFTSTEIKKVNKVLRNGLLSRPGGGSVVKEFQKSFAKIFGRKYAFSTTSGTTALHAAIVLLGLEAGDEVIIPALANIADASVLLQEDIKPVFADINKNTFCIDELDVEKKINSKTRAIYSCPYVWPACKYGKISSISEEA